MRNREPRRKVLLKARLSLAGAWSDGSIRNISSRGLLIHASAPVSRGTYIEVRRGRHVIVARVVWSKGREFGVHTQDRLDIEAIVSEPDLSGLDFKKAARAVPQFERRATPRPADLALQAARRKSAARLAQFACTAAFGAAVVVFVGIALVETLAQPLASVRSELSGESRVR